MKRMCFVSLCLKTYAHSTTFFHRKAPGHFDESSTRFWPLRLPTVMHHFAPNEKNVGKPLSKANLYLWFNKEKFMKAIQNDFETLKYRNIAEFWCQYLSKIFFEYISTELIMHRMVFLVQVFVYDENAKAHPCQAPI